MQCSLAMSGEETPKQSKPNSTTFQPGDVLAQRFCIVRFLASGGMGEVYEAQDRLLPGDNIALKTILVGQVASLEVEDRFKNEVLVARRVVHPNVCPIYDLFPLDDPANGRFLITMKLLPGETLAKRLREHWPLPPDEAYRIVQQVSHALQAAHRANVIHRDFKPGNIMLNGAGEEIVATVTDFGLASCLPAENRVSLEDRIWGTRGYIAPEVLKYKSPSAASDLYALGVVIHEIYFRERPDLCETKSPADGVREVIPKLCDRLMRGCLSADPLKRTRAFENALAAFERHSVPRFSFMPEASFPRRAWVLAGLAACIGLGAAWWEEDTLEGVIDPLPSKRFVALLSWPPAADLRLNSLLTGSLEAVAAALARAEASDRNLLIIAPREVSSYRDGAMPLKSCCDSVGANLALAASAIDIAGSYKITLKLLDASSNALLRKRSVSVAADQIASLTDKLLAAATRLLNLRLDTGQPGPRGGTNSPEAARHIANARNDLGQLNDAGLDSAIDNYRKALLADSRFVEAYGELARAYTRKFSASGDSVYLELARTNVNAALRLDSVAVNALIAKAEIHEEQGDADQAFRAIRQALALEPENFRTLSAEAEIYGRFRQPAESEATYRRLLELRPNHWLTYNRLGALLAEQCKYQESLKYFNLAKALAPRSAVVLNNVGAIAMKLGLVRDAEASFLSSSRIKESDTTYSNLSQLALAQLHYRQAVDYALKATEIHSEFDDLNWCQLGDCYEQMRGKAQQSRAAYEKAETEARRRLQLDSTKGPVWMSLALYLLKQAKPDNPMPLVEKAEHLGAAEIDSQMTKVRILELSNQRPKALETLTGCFKRGATPFEVTLIPDLNALRQDPGYARCETAAPVGTKL